MSSKPVPNPLLDAVDELTLPDRRREKQDVLETFEIDDDGVMVERQRKVDEKVVTITQDALLDQLVKVIHSDIGSTSRGASLAFERSILDGEALFKFISISTATGDWCRMAGITSTRNPTKDLRAWYVSTLSKPLTQTKERFHIDEMISWANYIRSKLDRPREWDFPQPCPLCAATEWWDEGDDRNKPGRTRPLVVRYKPMGPDTIDRAKALCRACERVWSVRALAYELEQAEKAQHAVSE